MREYTTNITKSGDKKFWTACLNSQITLLICSLALPAEQKNYNGNKFKLSRVYSCSIGFLCY